MYTNRTYDGMTQGSPGQGPEGLKKSYFYKKRKTNNPHSKDVNKRRREKVSTQNTHNSRNTQDDQDNSRSSNSNFRKSSIEINNLNKEAPSLSTDMGGPPNNPFINKNSPSNQTFSFNFSNDIFSNKPSLSFKERRKARSKAYFKKKFKGNDQQRPKNLVQVTETQWEVNKI